VKTKTHAFYASALVRSESEQLQAPTVLPLGISPWIHLNEKMVGHTASLDVVTLKQKFSPSGIESWSSNLYSAIPPHGTK